MSINFQEALETALIVFFEDTQRPYSLGAGYPKMVQLSFTGGDTKEFTSEHPQFAEMYLLATESQRVFHKVVRLSESNLAEFSRSVLALNETDADAMALIRHAIKSVDSRTRKCG